MNQPPTLEQLQARFWAPQDPTTGCRPPTRPTPHRTTDGQGYVYPARRAYEELHHTKLTSTQVLYPVCRTPHCGNPAHLQVGRPWVTRAREEFFLAQSRGQYLTCQEVARRVARPARSTLRALTGVTWAGLPDTPTQASLRACGELPNEHYPHPISTGTGRIVGPDGQVYPDIRRAEIMTGLDRQEIAAQLNIQDGTWQYESGPAPQEDLSSYGKGLNYGEFYVASRGLAVHLPLEPEEDETWKHYPPRPLTKPQ